MDLGLKGKVAIVTGGSVGIGAETARKLAGEGARVVIAARTRTTLEQAAEKIRAETGGEVVAIPVDTSDNLSARQLVDETVRQFGGVDILVNCAAHPGGLVRNSWTRPTRTTSCSTSTSSSSAIFACARPARRTCARRDGGASSMSAA